jgi:hypothetical protein
MATQAIQITMDPKIRQDFEAMAKSAAAIGKSLSEALSLGQGTNNAAKLDKMLKQAETTAKSLRAGLNNAEGDFRKIGEQMGLTGDSLNVFAETQAKAFKEQATQSFIANWREIQKQRGMSSRKVQAEEGALFWEGECPAATPACRLVGCNTGMGNYPIFISPDTDITPVYKCRRFYISLPWRIDSACKSSPCVIDPMARVAVRCIITAQGGRVILEPAIFIRLKLFGFPPLVAQPTDMCPDRLLKFLFPKPLFRIASGYEFINADTRLLLLHAGTQHKQQDAYRHKAQHSTTFPSKPYSTKSYQETQPQASCGVKAYVA